MVGKFKGRCGKYENWGHKSAQYPQQNNNTQQIYNKNQNQNRQARGYMMRGYRIFHRRCHKSGYWGHKKVG